jgi:hypothetical protein
MTAGSLPALVDVLLNVVPLELCSCTCALEGSGDIIEARFPGRLTGMIAEEVAKLLGPWLSKPGPIDIHLQSVWRGHGSDAACGHRH